MRPGSAADHSPPSSAAVMEDYNYTCTQSLGHTGPVTGYTLWWDDHMARRNRPVKNSFFWVTDKLIGNRALAGK